MQSTKHTIRIIELLSGKNLNFDLFFRKFKLEIINGKIKTNPCSFIEAAIATKKPPKIMQSLFEISFLDKILKNKHVVENIII